MSTCISTLQGEDKSPWQEVNRPVLNPCSWGSWELCWLCWPVSSQEFLSCSEQCVRSKIWIKSLLNELSNLLICSGLSCRLCKAEEQALRPLSASVLSLWSSSKSACVFLGLVLSETKKVWVAVLNRKTFCVAVLLYPGRRCWSRLFPLVRDQAVYY